MRTQVAWTLALVALVLSGTLASGCGSSKHHQADGGGGGGGDGGNNEFPNDGGADSATPPGTPGFTLSKTSGLHTDENGATDSFTVALTSQPKADVTLTLMSSDDTEGTVSPTTLTFTSINWNAPQTVTVTGVNDDEQDGDQAYSITFSPAVSTDANYSGKKPGDVTATNVDNDTAGVSILGAAALMTSEPNLSTTYMIKLNTQPSANVVITLTSSDTGEVTVAPATVTFTMDNWNAPQTITLTGVDDTLLDGPQTVKISSAATSADTSYNGIHIDDVSVINKDDETPAFVVVPTSGLRTFEDGRHGDHFTVALNSAPTADVTISVTSSNTAEVTVALSSLTFTKDNWNAPQRVDVFGVDDTLVDGDQPFTIVLGVATSADTRFMGIDPPDVTGINVDDETAGFTIDDEQLVAIEGGSPATFTITLNSAPTDDVSITLSSGTLAQATVSPGSMTFTKDNWNAPQTVTITAVDDTVADGPQVVSVLFSAATSNDTRYAGKMLDPISVQVLDNDSPGLNVHAIDLTTSEAGTTGSFTVALFSKPSATVTVPVLSKDIGEITLAPATLTFTVDNWQAAQTVTLTGVNDDLIDGNQVVELAIGPTTSTDTTYNGLTAPSLFATNIDDDTAGVIIEPTEGLETTESGGQASFTVSLTKKPSADVVFTLTVTKSGEATVNPATLTFTADNYNGKQTVTLRGVEDNGVADGDQTYEVVFAPAVSDDLNYRGLTPPRVDAINRDNDSPGLVTLDSDGVSVAGSLSTTEAGGSDSFYVRLKSRPTATVMLTISSTRTSEGTVAPLTLSIDPDAWSGNQLITVTGVDDQVADGNQPYQISISAVSTDERYNGLSTLVDAINTDNDSAGVTVKFNPGDTLPLLTREDGSRATFSLSLTSKPVQNVVIPLSSTDTGEGTVSPAMLTFTPDDWDADHTVTVTGVGDLIQDGDQPYFIVFGANTGDPTYAALPPVSQVALINIDTDSAGIFVSSGDLTTSEDGTTATFKISLRRAPTQDVTIPITSSNTNEGTVSPASVTFTSVSFAETVITVTGVDDQVADGRQSYQIVFGPAVSNDPSYAGRVAPALTAFNDDNDSPGITVNLPPSGLDTTETTPPGAPQTRTFTVSLNSKPVGIVTVPVSVTKPDEVDISPTTLTFSPTDWNGAHPVVVTSKDDLVQDGDQSYTVLLGPATATSSDANYVGLTYPPIPGINRDNDQAGIDVTAANPLVSFEDQNQTQPSFQVKLRSQPTATVTITLTSSNTAEGTVVPVTLTFTPGLTGTPNSYADPQTVHVQGVDDAVADHDQPYTITVATDPAGTDTTYAALSPVVLPALNRDNDSPGLLITGNTSSDFLTTSPTYELNPVDEAGTITRKFNVQLTSQPVADVTINLASDTLSEVTVDKNVLTFTAANWNVPQLVSVHGVDDSIDDGDQTVNVVIAAPVSTDTQYSALSGVSIAVTNIDNDSADFVVSTTTLSTYEEGTTTTFTVQLATQPVADVSFTVASSDTSEATVSPASMTFTAANWNVAQTATVTGINDLVRDGDTPYLIHLAPAVSMDPNYNGMSPTHGHDITGVNYEASKSCLDLITLEPTLPSGPYQLDTDLDGTASPRFYGYCDMVTAVNGITGGWTLLAWTGDSEAQGGVPYPGLNFVNANSIPMSTNRGSAVPAASLRALFDDSAELAQAQAITTMGRAAITKFGDLTAYEFVGTFEYGTLSDLTVGASFAGCTGLKTGTYTTIKDPDSATENNGTVVYLNQNLEYADDATLSNFTAAASYVWSVGNRTGYCALNGTAPASFVGTWQDGQYGPRYPNAAGAYSVWAR